MPKLAANISMMFTELPFLDRFGAAADAGFRAVEMLFPYEASEDVIADQMAARDLSVVLFNTPAGDWDSGERGLAALPDRVDEFREGVATAIRYAQSLACPRLHVMAGRTEGRDYAACRATLTDNLAFCADLAAPLGIDIMIEPLNTRRDVPGYFYDTTAMAMEIIHKIDRPNLKLQYDIYHMQIMEGDLAFTIERLLPWIGHIQLADNPGRGEPGTGEINYDWLLSYIDGLRYAGWIGCEYRPRTETRAGLHWALRYLDAGSTGQCA